MDILCHLCIVFVMLSHLFSADLWAPAGKGLNSLLLFVMFHFPMWYPGSGVVRDVSIPDFCRLSYFFASQPKIRCLVN